MIFDRELENYASWNINTKAWLRGHFRRL